MRYLIVFNDGETMVCEGYNLENALFFAELGDHSMNEIISVVKIDN